jgi:hypothetical protein
MHGVVHNTGSVLVGGVGNGDHVSALGAQRQDSAKHVLNETGHHNSRAFMVDECHGAQRTIVYWSVRGFVFLDNVWMGCVQGSPCALVGQLATKLAKVMSWHFVVDHARMWFALTNLRYCGTVSAGLT